MLRALHPPEKFAYVGVEGWAVALVRGSGFEIAPIPTTGINLGRRSGRGMDWAMFRVEITRLKTRHQARRSENAEERVINGVLHPSAKQNERRRRARKEGFSPAQVCE